MALAFLSNAPAPPRVTPAPASTPMPTTNFDLSVIQGLSPSQKYNNNLVSDIQSAYQTYLTGSPVGRGGQYAISAQQRYGYASIADAAAGYLQAAGIPILNAISGGPAANTGATGTTNGAGTTITLPDVPTVTGGGGTATTTTSDLNTLIGNQFQILSDAFKNAFGVATYEPPLQSQYYSGTPANVPIPDASSLAGYTSLPPGATPAAGGFNIKLILILAALGIGGYWLYKRYYG